LAQWKSHIFGRATDFEYNEPSPKTGPAKKIIFCFSGRVISPEKVWEGLGLAGSFGIFGLKIGLKRMPNVPDS